MIISSSAKNELAKLVDMLELGIALEPIEGRQ